MRRIKHPIVIIQLILTFSIIFICTLKGLERIYLSDFNPLNGDFQNYNGFRRFLAGQIPFQDFYFYLGLGPLYVNSCLLWLIGNDFTNSLFVTNFLTSLMFAMAAYLLFYLNGLRKILSLILTLLTLMLALRYFDFVPIDFYKYINFLDMVNPGNSIRMQRAFLPYLIVVIILIWSRTKLYKKAKNENYRAIFLGLLTGCGLAWSNDYGISVFVASFYLYTLIHFHFSIQFIKKLLFFLIGCILGVFGLISTLTMGNLLNWFDYNFLGVAQYQFWFFTTDYTEKLLTLSDLPINILLILGFLFIFYSSWKIRRHEYNLHHVLLLFITLSSMIAGYAYALSSVNRGMFEPFYFIFFLSVISTICKFVGGLFKILNKKLYYTAVFIFIISATLYVYPKASKIISDLSTDRGVKVDQLGGSLSQFGGSLNHVSENFVSNGQIFSTYSSALDVIENKYQPTGIDYIIHTLGDQYRKLYVEGFHNNDPEYITTLREDYNDWEIWAKRANWFFYREFLGRYEPIAVTDYNVIWQNTDKDFRIDSKINKIRLEQLSENSWEVYVKTDPYIVNAIADVSIDYSSGWNENRISGMGLRKVILVEDGWNEFKQYSIPENHKNYYIPVRIINGEGRAVISSYPANMTGLKIKTANLHNLFIDSVDYKAIENKMLKK